jgi:endo-1,4-beta-xylanase
VNEALNENGTLRSDVFYDILGEEYIKIAFETAAKADPRAKLYYNEYDIEYPGPKADGALKIVKMLKDAGLRIDGVGLQSHFEVGLTPSLEEQLESMDAFTQLGVEVAITELDIRMPLPATPAKLEQQKKDYSTTVDACMRTKSCVGVTVWDFWDMVSIRVSTDLLPLLICVSSM